MKITKFLWLVCFTVVGVGTLVTLNNTQWNGIPHEQYDRHDTMQGLYDIYDRDIQAIRDEIWVQEAEIRKLRRMLTHHITNSTMCNNPVFLTYSRERYDGLWVNNYEGIWDKYTDYTLHQRDAGFYCM